MTLELKARALTEQPYYLSGAFRSQAANLAKSHSKKDLQEICLIAVISSFIKKAGHACFASPSTLTKQFNAFSKLFGLKTITTPTLYNVLRRVIESAMIIRVTKFDKSRGRNDREFSINFDAIKASFKAVYNLATAKAAQCISRKLYSHRENVEVDDKSIDNNELHDVLQNENISIIHKTSIKKKDLKVKKNTSFDFDFKFGDDSHKAQALTNIAKSGKINGIECKSLIKLYKKHNVHMGESFARFLRFTVMKFNSVITATEGKGGILSGNRGMSDRAQRRKASMKLALADMGISKLTVGCISDNQSQERDVTPSNCPFALAGIATVNNNTAYIEHNA